MLCLIDIFSKYAQVIPLKDKKVVTIVNAFQKIDDLKRKPNKIWVHKGSELYNRSMKSWLEKNDIEIYSTHDEGKSVGAKRFIRTLKNKIYKHMTAFSKSVYIDKLIDIVNEYNNRYHGTIKMKPIDIKDNTYIAFNNEVNDKDLEFRVGDHVRIWKYKNIFAKVYTPNWSEEVFVIKNVSDLNGEKIIRTFYEKELQKTKQQEI